MGVGTAANPTPILTFPLKGKGLSAGLCIPWLRHQFESPPPVCMIHAPCRAMNRWALAILLYRQGGGRYAGGFQHSDP